MRKSEALSFLKIYKKKGSEIGISEEKDNVRPEGNRSTVYTLCPGFGKRSSTFVQAGQA